MDRLGRLKEKLTEGLNGIYVSSEKNIRYLTNFNYTDGYVLVTRNKCYVFADFRYIEAARASVGPDFEVVQMQGKRSEQLGALLRENEVTVLGYEDTRLTCAALESLKRDFPDMTFSPVGNLIDSLREFKDADEIQKIMKAQTIAEKAFDYILGFLNYDRTETEIALELEYFMRRYGASAASFDIIAVSGKASALPHGEPRRQKLEKGFFTMDFGALYEGYCSDMTRTVCIGIPDEEMKRVYDTVLAAQKAALEKAAAGVKCGELDKAARDIIDSAGYAGRFGHGLGHGVGMYIHEAPGVFGGSETVLTPGHVITVEPGIYIEGQYGVRIEDMVVIGEDGPQNITRCPKNLIII